MKVLHVTPHLGAGVGKAHAALSAAMPQAFDRRYVLLEAPRDHRFCDQVRRAGAHVEVAPDEPALMAALAQADIVQFEFWNHPRICALMARPDLPPLRSVVWCHVSGLFEPRIPTGLVERAGRFVLTSGCSRDAPGVREQRQRVELPVIGSGFGFDGPTDPGPAGKRRICYLGTVDFIKLHPGFFEMIDAVTGEDVEVDVIGAFDPAGPVATAHRAMRRPQRVRLLGQVDDPRSALRDCAIFVYPLQPRHYGTAENALVEAMSLGAAPLVLDHAAERAIVQDRLTGRVAGSMPDCARILRDMIDRPDETRALGRAAAQHVARTRTPRAAADAFTALYQALMLTPKATPCFADALGQSPLAWFLATQADDAPTAAHAHGAESKGSLAHFLAAFPDDADLLALARRGLHRAPSISPHPAHLWRPT